MMGSVSGQSQSSTHAGPLLQLGVRALKEHTSPQSDHAVWLLSTSPSGGRAPEKCASFWRPAQDGRCESTISSGGRAPEEHALPWWTACEGVKDGVCVISIPVGGKGSEGAHAWHGQQLNYVPVTLTRVSAGSWHTLGELVILKHWIWQPSLIIVQERLSINCVIVAMDWWRRAWSGDRLHSCLVHRKAFPGERLHPGETVCMVVSRRQVLWPIVHPTPMGTEPSGLDVRHWRRIPEPDRGGRFLALLLAIALDGSLPCCLLPLLGCPVDAVVAAGPWRASLNHP